MQNLRNLRDKLNQNVNFCVQIFLQNLLLKSSLFFKTVLFKNKFSFKISLVLKFLIPNLTRCIFNSESDT